MGLNVSNDTDLVDLHSFCEVVCHATFPHRRRRRQSTKADSVISGRDGSLNMMKSRSSTKELKNRLGAFNATLTRNLTCSDDSGGFQRKRTPELSTPREDREMAVS